MMTTGAAITEIIEAYYGNGERWMRITEIAKITGLSKQDLHDAITEMMEIPEFRAEPEPFGHRITAEDREWAPVIGGEARHLITFEG